MAEERPLWQRLVPIGLVALFVIPALVGLIYFVRSMMNAEPTAPKQIVQQVQIVRPPPPDTPPPPPPPPQQEEVDIPEPENTPEPIDAPPAEALGLDAEGGAGSDGFGLLARKGGRDLLATSGNAFGWYTGMLKNEILGRLQDNKEARSKSYKVTVRVWVRPDGGIDRIKLASSTGSRELDNAIEGVLAGMNRLPQAPPLEMPQPVSLQIVSRI